MSVNDLNVFRNFIESPDSNLSTIQKDLSILLYLNFDKLKPTSFRLGVRQRLISKLIVENKDKTLSLPEKSETNNSDTSIKKLSSLTVKSFRGFQGEQQFHFGKRYTFAYGRNGTGKSSLVDAIEFSLMSNIQEAKYKRIDIEEYIKNIYTKNGIIPHLYGLNNENKEVEIEANPEQYEFAVIERNRIDNFARISAETTAVQQQRLASLVGLDSWNSFISDFSKDIDDYIPLEDELDDAISKKRAELNAVKGRLSASKESVQDSSKVIEKFIKDYKEENLESFPSYFKKTAEKLQNKISQLGEDVVLMSDQEILQVKENQDQYLSDANVYNKHRVELAKFKDSLSLVELARAIVAQKDTQSNRCPACLTPIRDENGKLQVNVDPYDHAVEVQEQFKAAVQLEKKLDDDKQKLTQELRLLSTQLQTLERHLQKYCDTKSINKLLESIENFFNNKQSIPQTVWITDEEASSIQSLIIKYNDVNSKKMDEKKKLKIQLTHINEQNTAFEAANKVIVRASQLQDKLKKNIDLIQVELTNLVKKSETSKKRNLPFKKNAEAYRQIIQKLKVYTDSLPGKELVDMNELTLKIYNLINKYDFDSEQLTTLKLPLSANQVIRICFNVQDAPVVDALDVLSEGHIRTLGLAILLAKALKTKQPFIIFDDVVNAIDDDHRQAIAEIITDEDGEFSDIQWIVTTHGQEFAKQLISGTSMSVKSDIKEITFKGKGLGSDIQPIEETQNYLYQAQNKLDEEDIRGCLADCRRGAEVLMNKLWKLYSKRFNSRINIQVDPIRPIPETKNVFNALRSAFRKKLKGNESELAVMNTVFSKLDILLDDKGISWFLLNKGTHEEEDAEQHDRVAASKILNDLLIPLDDELTKGIHVKGSVLCFRSKSN